MKSEAAPLPTSMSPTTKPVTASENVNVAVNGALLVAGTPVIPTVGAVLSTSYVFSFVPVGVVFASAVSAVSVMSWVPANDSVTVAFRPARSPPLAVTSYREDEPGTAAASSIAVVPLTVKSAASTFCTSSLNVMRQVRLSAFVGDVVGVWRSMDVTCGAVVSGVVYSDVAWVAAALSLPAGSMATSMATSTVTSPSDAGVISAV